MRTFQSILVPTDFSPPSEHAVERAFELAASQDAKVHLLHAYHVPSFPDGIALGVDVVKPIEQAAIQALAAVTETYRTRPEFGGVILKMGDPRDVILDHARALPADLIVMSTHSRSGLERWVLGSVAERVVRSAPCPVLVIPPPPKPVHLSGRPLPAKSRPSAPDTPAR